MKKILIGIDPDTEKNGFAMIIDEDKYLDNLSFFDLFKRVHQIKNNPKYCEYKIIAYIECGFLNGGNRHFQNQKSTAYNGKISERVGANHETAKKICEMMEFLGIEYVKVKPTRRKADKKEFEMITGIKKTTNQEQRDAFLLIFGR